MRVNIKKVLIAGLVLTGCQSVFAGGGTSANSPQRHSKSVAMAESEQRFVYKVIPSVSTREVEGLPPGLEATFTVQCNQKFIKVVRQDVTDGDNIAKMILLGALVVEDTTMICSAVQDMTADAGHAYSGVEYQVFPIGTP